MKWSRETRSLMSAQILIWLGVVAFSLLLMIGCTVTPPPAGTNLGSPSDPVWVAGDSISWPTAVRMNSTYGIGIGGTGCVKEPSISTQMNVKMSETGEKPHVVVVITGINDLVGAVTVPDLANCAEAFRATYEGQGIDVRFVTQPVPDNGFGSWGNLVDYSNWLRLVYPDTIDCGAAGHPTESVFNNSYPVHPSSAGYDSYAACITGGIK